MLHEIACDESARPAEPGLAVNGDRSIDVLLNDLKELPDDGLCRHRAVNEEEVVVVEARVRKPPSVVHLHIQPNDRSHFVFPEVRKIRFWCVQWVTFINRKFIMNQNFCTQESIPTN